MPNSADLNRLPPAVLRTMAENLRDTAATMDRIADQTERQHMAQMARIERQRARHLAQTMLDELLGDGFAPDQAAEKAARRYGVPVEYLEICYRKQRRDRQKLDRLNQDREIIALYRQGFTDKEIAHRLKCHEKTVARHRRRILADSAAIADLHDTLTRIKGRGITHELKRLGGHLA